MLSLYLLALLAGAVATVLGFLGTHWKPGEKIDFAPVVAELRYWVLFEPRRWLLTSRARLRQRRNLRGQRAGGGRIAGRSQDVVD
jgi:hypothetical protein